MAEGNSSTASTINPLHSQTFVQSFLSAFDDQEDCDIYFNVEGKSIGAHKMVLKNSIRGLYELEAQPNKDKNHNEIRVESMDFDAFKSLLR